MRLALSAGRFRLVLTRLGAAFILSSGTLPMACVSRLGDLDSSDEPGPTAQPSAASGHESRDATAAMSGDPVVRPTSVESSTGPASDDGIDPTCRDCDSSRATESSEQPGRAVCTSGTYLASTDGGAAECRPCATGTFSSEVNSPMCSPHSLCPAGTFAATAGTALSDVVCAGCTSGYYAAEPGLDNCTQWSDCQPGQFVSQGGSSEADRQCQDCADGQTSTVVNSGACWAAGDCAAGFVQAAPDADGGAPGCSECSTGTYCAGGEGAAVPCGPETWDDDANPATPCVDKTSCVAGEYVSTPGDGATDRQCAACASGYSTEVNSTQCQEWSTCAQGQYIATAGTSLADRVCAACDEGTFSEIENAAACNAWLTCAAPTEYVAAAPSATANRGCGTCEPPRFTLQDNDETCVVFAYQMSGGQVVMEAEHFHLTSSQGTDHAWRELSLSGTSGGTCLELWPDTDATWLNSPAMTAPKLEYNVNFTQTGTFYIHIRGDTGAQTSGTSDSCYAGVDGAVTSAYMFPSVSGAWAWLTQSVSVSTLGLHTVQVFGREDGFRLDKIVVSASNVPPSGAGPAESALQ